jgi:dipeptidase E
MRRLLLFSNSTNHGEGYLDHAAGPIREFLGPVRRLVFVPFALKDHAGYTARARQRLAEEGIEVEGLTLDIAGPPLLAGADAVFVGGGNTFRLLRVLQTSGLMELLQERAREGMPYLGASAGINIAAPTIRTTNDMPIVQPPSFDALDLVPFQINPHYIDPDPSSRHMGETREERLLQFLEENDVPVLGLREAAWLHVEGDHGTLEGKNGARIFRPGRDPEERAPGARLDDLLIA